MSAQADRIVLGDGKPVDPAGVEAAFTGLWREAGGKFAGGSESSVVRACLWNLVAHLPGPHAGLTQVKRLDKLLDDLTQGIPSRVIRLQSRDPETAPKGTDVQAWVATHCHPNTSGGGTVNAEEVTLAAYG